MGSDKHEEKEPRLLFLDLMGMQGVSVYALMLRPALPGRGCPLLS